jgi:hypothetical protein
MVADCAVPRVVSVFVVVAFAGYVGGTNVVHVTDVLPAQSISDAPSVTGSTMAASNLFDRAYKVAVDHGYTFDTLTTSYTRLLTTLLSFGFTPEEVNVVIPEFARVKGVAVAPNPGRDEPEPCRWQPTFDDDVQALQDAIFARRHQSAETFFDSIGLKPRPHGQHPDPTAFDMLPHELEAQFGVSTSRPLSQHYIHWVARRAEVEAKFDQMDPDEASYERQVRATTYDYQNPRWALQCRGALSRAEMSWRETVPHDLNAADRTNHYYRALEAAVDAAMARIQRRGVAVIVTDRSLDGSPAWIDRLRRQFRNLRFVSFDGRLSQTDREGDGSVDHMSEDVSRQLCALYHRLRMVLDGNEHPAEMTPATRLKLRELLLHYRSSVQRVVPLTVASFLNADLVVLDGALHRFGVGTAHLVWSELRRALPSSPEAADFDAFYRGIFEEAFFLRSSLQEGIVRAIARDVPTGSAVVVAHPFSECKETAFGNGTVASDPLDCVAVRDMMDDLLATVDNAPFTSGTATRWFALGQPLVIAPRDSPARFDVPPNARPRPSEGPPTGRVRVDYRITGMQWGPPRELAEEESPPFFGDEFEDLIRLEAEARRATPSSADANAAFPRSSHEQLATPTKGEL